MGLITYVKNEHGYVDCKEGVDGTAFHRECSRIPEICYYFWCSVVFNK
jgi:hypothetical protein